MGRRSGDGAELAIIELVDNPREKEALEAARKRTKEPAKKKGAETKAGAAGSKKEEESDSEK
jgi:hypothetical protein